jgi:hypothetical protein
MLAARYLVVRGALASGEVRCGEGAAPVGEQER